MNKSDFGLLAYGYILGIGLISSLVCMEGGDFIIGLVLFAFNIYQAYKMIISILGYEQMMRNLQEKREALEAFAKLEIKFGIKESE